MTTCPTCPTCGCQIHSPFSWQPDVVIHDVEECRIRDEREKLWLSVVGVRPSKRSLSRSGEMVPSLTQCEEANPEERGIRGEGEISEEQRADEHIDRQIQDRIEARHFKENPLNA